MKPSTTLPTIASLALSTLLITSSSSAAPLNIDTNSNNGGALALTLNINLGQDPLGANAIGNPNQLFTFSSTQFISALPEAVVNGTEPTGGLPGATGTFNFGLHSALDMICYNITLNNFQGDFSSPATTATHIHEAALGASGPPRIAFPNPEVVAGGDGTVRNSAGCLKGPFVTGVVVDGKDSGEGFRVEMIEANPAAFMADTHSSLALAGAVRGQLA
ncbi:hypothetical protein ONS95_001403 [Cadophora gregata]|uniref:uncharacterized protein n=1 Tax=Cadophora gregata TaxID=51156 RepID=UPI0026DAF9F2|nr:uncharacterized protein ONS95_001403 [Cadophora gregata]KAK0111023.1 hypothetical protein ONS95_001403 [Cadophora gregata]KAK0112519.1 hypothetical protein ONS96_001755 [Cadophora gregata f. sp. sojae]